jgi:hypothetical protein
MPSKGTHFHKDEILRGVLQYAPTATHLNLKKHNAQHSPIEIRILKNTDDRFLIIDNKQLYHIGASLKDLGKRWFAFSRSDNLREDGFLDELARLERFTMTRLDYSRSN